MNPTNLLLPLTFLGLCLGSSRPLGAAESHPNTITARDARETRPIAGWTVHISRELLAKETKPTQRALELLRKQLEEIVRVVPANAVVELRKVPLYFSPAYQPGRSEAAFHPDAGWLRDNGRDPAMARSIEFAGVADFEAEMNRMPNFALHELTHAYHFRVLQDGFDNAELKAAYERAQAGGKYERVERWHGNGKPNTFERAYAMTDPMEYFAETTEAFFVRNDFFPFTREELKQHDPEMPALLEKLWDATPGTPQSNQVERAATSRATAPPASNSDKLRDLTAKAGKGDIAAQFSLALRYRDGKGVKRDYAEAMRWAHLAADRGDAAAMDFVGWMFFQGHGVKHNPEIAAGYFNAAAGESATAAWNLGQCYFGAQGVEQDIPKALETWKKAAAMGHGGAASTAAMVYLAGDGIAPDAAEARKLAERAAELNDPNGLVVMGEIHYQAGETEQARACWTKVSHMKPVGLTGHLAAENLYILCNPAIATPGLQFISAGHLKQFWRSDHYGDLSNGVLSRPAIAIATP